PWTVSRSVSLYDRPSQKFPHFFPKSLPAKEKKCRGYAAVRYDAMRGMPPACSALRTAGSRHDVRCLRLARRPPERDASASGPRTPGRLQLADPARRLDPGGGVRRAEELLGPARRPPRRNRRRALLAGPDARLADELHVDGQDGRRPPGGRRPGRGEDRVGGR